MRLKLIVIRTNDPARLSQFYTTLGLSFVYHRHGNSPYHYSTVLGDTVVEIYPLNKGQVEADKHLRLGIAVANFDEVITTLKNNLCQFFTEPQQTDYGYIAVVEDPDGRKVELYKE